MYILSYELFKNRLSAAISTFLYLWAPYHFLTIFVSASIGTSFVFMFLPLILLGIHKTSQENGSHSKLWIAFTALGFAGSMLSHFITTVSLAPLVGIFILWLLLHSPNRFLSRGQPASGWQLIKRLFVAFILGLSLSAFYLLPAAVYSKETQVSSGAFSEIYKNQFVNLSQLIYSKWGYGISDNAKDGVISYQIGIAQWLAFFSSFIIFWKKPIKKQRRLLFTLSGIFLINIFLMIDLSRPIWDLASKFIVLDFPIMFLLSATFCGAVLGGLVVSNLKGTTRFLITVLFLAVALYTNRNHLNVNLYTNISVKEYVSAEITTNSYHEYLPKTADLKLFSEPIKRVLPENVLIKKFDQDSRGTSIAIENPKDQQITLGHFVFPGITIYIDNQRQGYLKDERGRITFPLSQGSHSITVKFEETNLIKISKLITILSILTFFIITAGGTKTGSPTEGAPELLPGGMAVGLSSDRTRRKKNEQKT